MEQKPFYLCGCTRQMQDGSISEVRPTCEQHNAPVKDLVLNAETVKIKAMLPPQG